MRWTSAWFATLLLGCGSAGTKPDDMSVKEHERAAARDDSAAGAHQGQATMFGTAPGRTAAPHYSLSSSMQRRADEHRAAALTLQQDEASACMALPEAARATCPLMAHEVAAVEETADGVRVTYRGADPEVLLAQANCHAAHGATGGREGMDGCPLYIKGLRISTERAPGGAILVLATDDADGRRALNDIYVPTP